VTARRFLVSGRVQGVGFRWFVTHLGSELGLRGVVRNLRDGRVEVVAAGTDSALAQLAEALADGPPAARVDGVETAQVEDEASLPKRFAAE
jgi:acylphosphatase